MKTVFISYRRSASQHLARSIFQYLRSRGYDVYLDVETTDAGEFDTIILRQIAARTHFIVLLSPGSLERCVQEGDWLRREIEEAMRLNRNIVPIIEEGFNFNEEMQFLPESWRSEFQRINMMPLNHFYFEAGMETLRTRFLKPPEYTIEVKPAPEEDQAEVQRRIEQVVAVPPAPEGLDLNAAISGYYEASKAEDWNRALALLDQIEVSGKAPYFDVEACRQDVQQRVGVVEAADHYKNLLIMAQHEPPQRVRTALRIFRKSYPGYDPDSLAAELGLVSNAPGILPRPFAWIDIPGSLVDIEEGYGQFQVEDFAIGKYPVTNAQFQVFVEASDGYSNAQWWDFSGDATLFRKDNPQPQTTGFEGDDHPRTNVTWFEAVAFCLWLSWKSGDKIILPTEQQWQRAALGDTGWIYPWGDVWDGSRCNNSVDPNDSGRTSPVTKYEGLGDSPYGVVDMAGNVWEWCVTDYATGNQDIGGHSYSHVLRGGAMFNTDQDHIRAAFRGEGVPGRFDPGWGFRCVRLYEP